jgi:hypothetical protein
MNVKKLECFKKVAAVIGDEQAEIELQAVYAEVNKRLIFDSKKINCCFPWHITPQGFEFWEAIARKTGDFADD